MGRKLTAAGRRGKFLLLSLDDDAVLVVHLRMTWPAASPERRATLRRSPRTPMSSVTLEDGTELRFVDPRTFGEWFVSSETWTIVAYPSSSPISGVTRCWRDFRPPTSRPGSPAAAPGSRLCSPTSGSIAGIGSIYADESCFRAKLRPDRAGGSLTPTEVAALARAARAVLREAVASRGSSLRDLGYRDLAGEVGSFQERHAVYDRAGGAVPALRGPGRSGSRSEPAPPTCARAASSEPGDGAKPGPFGQSPGSRSGTDNVISTCS